MPECGCCGSWVSDDYERVHKPENCEQVRCCPNCEYIRDGGEVRPTHRYESAREGEQLATDGAGRDRPDWEGEQ